MESPIQPVVRHINVYPVKSVGGTDSTRCRSNRGVR